MSVETLGLFSVAAVLLALSPGPDNLFVFTQSLVHGAKVGLWVILGLCSGLLFHALLVAFGVAAALKAAPTLFNFLRLVGAAYLLWLAWQAWRAPVTLASARNVDLAPLALYRRGIVMNVSNPKVAIFFLAFLPQFTQPDGWPVALQVILLGALFMVWGFLVFTAIALAAGWLHSQCVIGSRLQVLNRCAALVFVGLAVRIVLEALGVTA